MVTEVCSGFDTTGALAPYYSTTVISVPRWLSARAAGVSKPQCLPDSAEVYLLFRNINLGHF